MKSEVAYQVEILLSTESVWQKIGGLTKTEAEAVAVRSDAAAAWPSGTPMFRVVKHTITSEVVDV